MNELTGQWFDGRSSRALGVRLRLAMPGVLRVEDAQGDAHDWPLAEITLSPRLGSTPRMLRRHGHGQIECADSPLLDAWLPRHSSRIEAFADWLERRRTAIALAAFVTVLTTVGFVQFGVPALARVVAERIPQAVERHASAQVVVLLERSHLAPTQQSPDRQARLQREFAHLIQDEPRASQMQLRIVDAPGIGANAFALPDGRIYVTDQLLAQVGSDDALLAVLAHEAGHHVHRHGMRQALESSSVFLLAGMLFGDVSGSSLAVSIPAVLLSNGFSRGHEREADAYAFGLLERRGRSPQAFADMLRRLERSSPKGRAEGAAGYLSTHPPNPERIRAAEAAALTGAP
ncbi:M48 family metallopeptidase [Lysobacter cavernae]|uniref:M48 family metallopeptidase n=1 Tax=Lysobacter cavernae TaxID=1685901 RepID=A0ABV7RJN1_9GAMM